MQLKRGRMLDHLHLRSRDLVASRRFYGAVLEILGIPVVDGPGHFFADELWVDGGDTPSRVHLAFQAPDRATVDRWYAAGLAAGGRDNGAPASAPITPATTPPSCSTPTATMSRPSSTAPPNAAPTP